ncbi:MAG TPA: site-2 protease family protein [Verrucomicrobiae bacterium]|nr:site-2 protease family protein [Verrucomicrobiae bacterium]
MLVAIVIAIMVLAACVTLHELGHFLAAKAVGVHPSCFSLGFGPKLWSTTRNNTEWRISALPFGAYVRLPDDIEEDLSLPRQSVVYAAGPFANYLAAVLALVCLTVFGPNTSERTVADGFIFPAVAMVETLKSIPAGIDSGGRDFEGPVGIVKVGGGMVDNGEVLTDAEHPEPPTPWIRVFVLFAVLNVALMVTNLMPIPVFDGGRMLLAGISGFGTLLLRRSWRIPEAAQTAVLVVTTIPLFGLVLLITFHDIFQ